MIQRDVKLWKVFFKKTSELRSSATKLNLGMFRTLECGKVGIYQSYGTGGHNGYGERERENIDNSKTKPSYFKLSYCLTSVDKNNGQMGLGTS